MRKFANGLQRLAGATITGALSKKPFVLPDVDSGYPVCKKIGKEGDENETDVSLRAYLARLSDEHLATYDSAWSDGQVMSWDGNFRNDGNLMLVCCEREVDVAEFRRVLEEHLRLRRARGKGTL